MPILQPFILKTIKKSLKIIQKEDLILGAKYSSPGIFVKSERPDKLLNEKAGNVIPAKYFPISHSQHS